MFESTPILIQTPFASPNWLLKILPWVNIGSSVYKVSSINFEEKTSQQRLTIPKNTNIITAADSYFLSDLLRCVSLFKPLPEELIQEIIKSVYQKNVKAGDIIVKQGDIGKAFYIIINGQYNVTNKTIDDKETILNSLTSGDYFGEMALLKEIPRQATITATTKGSLLVLNKETFEKIVSDSQLKKQLEEIFEVRKKELATIKQPNESLLFLTQFEEPPYPDNYPNFIENSTENQLDIIQATITLNTKNNNENYSQQLDEQLEIAAKKMEDREEWEIINNKKYGLLNNISSAMSCDAQLKPLTPDNFDDLLSLVWNKPSFFLANPKAIAVFAKKCTHNSIVLETVEMFGSSFITWRGVPIIPSNNMVVNNNSGIQSASILLMRIGEKEKGVVGLYKGNSNLYKTSNLTIEPIADANEDIISKYKITRHFSVFILALDAIAVLRNVSLGS
ncbi:Cyclic nucleotide-binding domain-containing protein [Candidatus Trichorickettsia mobilis]|uniref:Cyclic nucleotide-binding domain-containing protein n=1 Tax=Candidatus Trichorickettsia mobilis TaxID=1346319 RepID=A0ABZ0UWL7_9RICK|nr:cyclic nucleotide-binding domain-containing protein [Candidatus Trichorickettsia mobilis]WPY01012.1 Cyclic nucleotide-binding domain-containing protein [Candidatus Trichorickettsia mobilis]